MQRVLLSLLAVIGLYFGGRALVRAFASDETRIRWVVDRMVEGFNDTRMNPILDGLDETYLDDTYGADRQLLRAAAASVFFQAKDPVTKKFLYRLEWQPSAPLAIEARGDAPKRAQLGLELTFFRRHGETEELAWSVHVDGTLEKQGGEWRFVRSDTKTKSGERIR